MALLQTLLRPVKKLIDQLCSEKKYYQTLTYYVPAPPSRNTSYREKKFDSLTHKFLNLGFEVIEVKTIGHQSTGQNGFWVLFVLQALTDEAKKLDLDFDDNAELSSDSELEIEYD